MDRNNHQRRLPRCADSTRAYRRGELMATKQRTFAVGDHKIRIKSRPKLWRGNPNGYAVDINGDSYHVNALTREEAEDHAFGRWVTANAKNQKEVWQ